MKEDVDAALKFLPIFEQQGYEFGEIKTDSDLLPLVVYSCEVRDFIKVLYRQGFTIDFDWPNWQSEAQRYYDQKDMLQEADLETLRRLLTVHLRKDRFSDGHLLSMLKSGHITAILRRLREIRDEMEGN